MNTSNAPLSSELDGVWYTPPPTSSSSGAAGRARGGSRRSRFTSARPGRRALETIRMAAPTRHGRRRVAAFGREVRESGSGNHRAAGRLSPPVSGPAARNLGRRHLGDADDRHEPAPAGRPAGAGALCVPKRGAWEAVPRSYLLAARGLGARARRVPRHRGRSTRIQAARAAGMQVIGLATTHPPDQLSADACAASLAHVHLGRLDRDAQGRSRMEILVLEV